MLPAAVCKIRGCPFPVLCSRQSVSSFWHVPSTLGNSLFPSAPNIPHLSEEGDGRPLPSNNRRKAARIFATSLKTACWEELLGAAAIRRRRQPPSFYYFYECSKLGGSRILFFARGALPLPFPFCVFCFRHGQSIRKAFTLCRQRLAHCSRFPTTADCDVINSRQAATGRVFSSFVLPLPHFPFLLFGEQSQPIFGCQNPHNTNNNTQTTCCWGMIRGHG